jgi:hypothetical protein
MTGTSHVRGPQHAHFQASHCEFCDSKFIKKDIGKTHGDDTHLFVDKHCINKAPTMPGCVLNEKHLLPELELGAAGGHKCPRMCLGSVHVFCGADKDHFCNNLQLNECDLQSVGN